MPELLSPLFCDVAEMEADEARRKMAAGGGHGGGLAGWNLHCL